MENQHRKISGYRELSQAEIDLMNEIKAKGEELAALCEKVEHHITTQASSVYAMGTDDARRAELARIGAAHPYGWYFMAKTEMQTAFMKLVRAVAQPTTF